MEEKNLITYIVITSSAVVFLVCVVLIDMFLLLRKRRQLAFKEKELSQRKIDDLIRKNEVESVNALLQGKNSERRRISQELHDRLGGILFTAKIYHNATLKKIQEVKDQEEESFGKLKGLLDDAVKEVRRISHDLYAGSLANFGYTVAMHQLIAAIEEANDIKIELRAQKEMDDQEEEVQYQLHAISQELLSNTLKHANASKVEIEVEVDNELIFRYRDNGVGFDTSRSYEGIGLKNIQERVANLGGILSVESAQNQGTSYIVTIPLAK
ncbi:MAG TPA: sensor histidine kinase [Cryomorphaceae bacterium]|nr:sensor histidine kinase [Cryomorphaceae bacterium]